MANAASAPFGGKSSRANVQRGVLLCGAGYLRKSAPEKPLIRVVPFPGANRHRVMVKHSYCAQWVARGADFLGSQLTLSSAEAVRCARKITDPVLARLLNT